MTEKTTTDNLIGKQLGDYRLDHLLATGGMARIYSGVDVKLGRRAAIKVVTQDMLEADSTLTERFQREAKAVANLEHPHIISIYQYGEYENLYFLAMKLVDGKDLADSLNQHIRQRQLMEPRRLLDILAQVADALDHAHEHGIIHRDVKPSNILLGANDRAILTDFGLVLRQQVDKTMGTAFGTPRYISPEQALASERAVPQSDIYSLAVIVYEAVTGSMVFRADTAMQIALSHISEPPPPPTSVNPNVPRSVEREILKALDKDPKKRHKTAAQFIAALRDAYGPLLDAPTEPPPELARSLTPVMSEPPDFEALLAEKQAEEAAAKAQQAAQPKRERGKGGGCRMRLIAVLVLGLLAGVLIFTQQDNLPELAAIPVVGPMLDNASRADDTDDTLVANTTPTDVPASPPPAETTESEPDDEETAPLVLTGGEPVRLAYTFEALALRNDGAQALDVRELSAARPDGAARFDGGRISQGTIPPGACVLILLQGRRVDPPPGVNCDSVHGEFLLTASDLFWRAGAGATFDVRLGDAVLANCPTIPRGGSDACTFDWPALSGD